MKKNGFELNAIFCVADEMIENKGEDSFCHEVDENDFLIAAFDGCGGAGGKRYKNYSEKTGAFIGSRAVCGSVQAWFRESKQPEQIHKYIQDSLAVCKKYGDATGRIMGSLSKSFPTTAAIILGNIIKNQVVAHCLWAGDSRCYMLDEEGLHQLSIDDLEGQDALSNLTDDGAMTNVISADAPFEIHNLKATIERGCILLTATDGCFGYLNSPMEFEHLLLETLMNAKNIHEWKVALHKRMGDVAGDDFTLCVAVCGFKDFNDIKNNYSDRSKFLYDNYINTQQDVHVLWEEYKKSYVLGE